MIKRCCQFLLCFTIKLYYLYLPLIVYLRSLYLSFLTGTGCNACYMEKLDNVGLWDNKDNKDKSHPNQVLF